VVHFAETGRHFITDAIRELL